MLTLSSRRVGRLVMEGRIVQTLRLGTLKIYEAVRSCFGRGYWIGSKPWIGKDKWK